jgi:predicted protein tyrosine phosphatase
MSEAALLTDDSGICIATLSQARRHKRDFGAVITLEDPGTRAGHRLRFNRNPAPPHLVLTFEDVDNEISEIRTATIEQVSAALDFARRHSTGTLLIHCFHGVGRSAAIGLAILADRFGNTAEAKAVEALFKLRPTATPNLVVVKFADVLLDRQGALVTALNAYEATDPAIMERRRLRAEMLVSRPELFASR